MTEQNDNIIKKRGRPKGTIKYQTEEERSKAAHDSTIKSLRKQYCVKHNVTREQIILKKQNNAIKYALIHINRLNTDNKLKLAEFILNSVNI